MRARIGDLSVGPVGLGGAGWSIRPDLDEERSIRTIHAALDAGVTLLDTARAYTTVDHAAHNEALIARALAQRPDVADVLVATKGGHFRTGPAKWGVDGRPAALRSDCEASLRALRVDAIDLYFLHHPDPGVPLAESVGALESLRAEGLVRMIGVSNINTSQLAIARAVTTIDAVENHFSPLDQDDLPVVEQCAAAGIAYLAYSPLRGVAIESAGQASGGLPGCRGVAHEAGVSLPRLLVAWMLRLGDVIPIVGATRPESARDTAAAASLRLPESAWAVVDAEVAERARGGVQTGP